jgi:hypothetical protein
MMNKIRLCYGCGTVLKNSEHIGIPIAQDEITGMLVLANEICENCMRKYARQTLINKSINKIVKSDSELKGKPMMVYGSGNKFEVLVLPRLSKDVVELFSRKPNNIPFAFD